MVEVKSSEAASREGREPAGEARLGSAVLTVLLLLGLASAACQPRPRIPEGVAPPDPPLVRNPYLQDVRASSALVRWRVEEAPPGAEPVDLGRVRYGAPGNPSKEAPVERLDRGGRRARLTGLSPGEEVEYLVEQSGRVLGAHRFRAAPPDTSKAPVRALAFGDSGWGSPAQVRLARLMRSEEWELAVHVGDIAYDHGSETDLTTRHFRVYGELLARVPFYPAPGNHDLLTEGGAPYDRAFDWPGPENRRWYSFRWGRSRFVALDTDTEEAVESLEDGEGEQYRWLVETLREAARDTTLRWTVVYMHRPVYSHGTGLTGHGGEEELREQLEPLFLRHGVDLVLAGHEHHYERSHPLRRGEPVQPGCAPVYIITGTGGASQFGRDVAADRHTASVTLEHSFVALHFGPRILQGRVVGETGESLDRFSIVPYREETAEAGRCE